MATYAIGDLQGCYTPLRRLLDRLDFAPSRDRLWFVGDLVNRGPESLETLRFVRSLGDAAVAVLGNHDFDLLRRAAGGRAHRRDTLAPILRAPDRDELIDWLRRRPLLHIDPANRWCAVHAGLHPRWTLAACAARAAEVESVLRGEGWRDFCLDLLRDPLPESDPEEEEGACAARLRFTAAVLTRVRYCTADGRFDWATRAGEPTDAAFRPWFGIEAPWRGECRVVYGHWAARGLVTDQPHVAGIDTGCVWGGALTALRLDDPTLSPREGVTQVSCPAVQEIGPT